MATPARRHRWLLRIREELQAGVDLHDIELEAEVRLWLETLPDAEYASALRLAELLAVKGRELTEPYVKRLELGLCELRPGPYRITFWMPEDRRVAVLLTVFRKRRDNERREKDRAYRAQRVCAEHHHTPREHDVFTRSRKGGK